MIMSMLRNMNKAKLPAIAGIISIFANTFFNWLFIFGIWIFPQMGEAGAALATGLARFIEMMIVLILSLEEYVRLGISLWLLFSRKWMKNLTKA